MCLVCKAVLLGSRKVKKKKKEKLDWFLGENILLFWQRDESHSLKVKDKASQTYSNTLLCQVRGSVLTVKGTHLLPD